MDQTRPSKPRILPTAIVAGLVLALMSWALLRLAYLHAWVLPERLRHTDSGAGPAVADTALGVVVAPLAVVTLLLAGYAGWFLRRHDSHLALRNFLRSWPPVFLGFLLAWGLSLFVALMFERQLLGSFAQLAGYRSAIEGSLLLLAVVPMPLALAMWYRYLRE